MLIFFLFSVPLLLLKPCSSTTILVDGASNVVVGDSIIFRLKNHSSLYIFQNQRAFSVCNFTQASLLTKPNFNSYVWNTSRPGIFYFTINNGSKNCEGSEKMAVTVSLKSAPPAAAPTPSSGAEPWPFQPRQGVAPVSQTSPATMPLVPDKGGGIQFINSNPAVPLPTDEIDSATIRPVSTSSLSPKVVKMILFPAQVAILGIVFLVLIEL